MSNWVFRRRPDNPALGRVEPLLPPVRNIWVLSGGGAQGAVQVGMMRELLEAGHRPDACIAVSVGALNSAFVAYDPTPTRVDDLERVWSAMGTGAIFGNKRQIALNVLRRSPSLFTNDKLRALVSQWAPVGDVSELAIPFVVATTHLHTGRAGHHSTGSLADLLCASAAVPALLPPVRLPDPLTGESSWHVDGAVSENVPLSAVSGLAESRGWGNDDVRVFVLDATHASRERVLRTPLDTLVAALSATLASQKEAPVPHNASVVRIKAGGTVSIIDFSRTAELIELGASRARAALESAVWAPISKDQSTGAPDTVLV